MPFADAFYDLKTGLYNVKGCRIMPARTVSSQTYALTRNIIRRLHCVRADTGNLGAIDVMIDPIHVADLDSLFTEWLETYHCELLCLPNPVVVVDATLPGYLGLMEEMDILAEQFGTPILIRSYHEEEEESLPQDRWCSV